MKKEIENQKNTGFNKKTFAKNTFHVFLSNLLLILAGLFTGFFVPKFLGVESYGYFKTFSLYAAYVSIFQFGLINGIFLFYGGKNMDELPTTRFRLYSRILFAIEGVVAIIGFIVAFTVFSGIWSAIVVLLSIYSFSVNCMMYFQQISQITQQFKQYSKILLLQSILKIVALGILWVVSYFFATNNISLLVYTTCYTLIFVIIFVWYLIAYRSIVFGKADSFVSNKKDVNQLFKIGMPLLIADFVVVLVYACDRQVVNIFFSNEDFAYFAFAYTIISLVTTAVAAISTVLYPALKRMNQDLLIKSFNKMISGMFAVGFLLLTCFFPIQWIIEKFLSEYVSSIIIVKIIFPGVIITSVINIVIQNYYKTFNKNMLYFWISLGVLALSIGFNIGAYYIFHNTESIAASSIIVFFIWLITSQLYFSRKYNLKIWKNTIYAFIVSTLFYFAVFITSSIIVSFMLFFISYLIITIVFFNKNIYHFIIGRLNKKIERNTDNPNQHRNAIKKKQMMDDYLKAFSKSKKRMSILFVSMTFVFIFGTLSGSFIFQNSYQSISNEIVNQRAEDESNFSYGTVVPSSNVNSMKEYKDLLEEQYIFYVDMRLTSKAFFSSQLSNQNIPLTIYPNYSDSTLTSSIVSMHSATFEDANSYYGFELVDGSNFPTEASNNSLEVYITQAYADEILNSDFPSEDYDYSDLNNYVVKCRTSKSQLLDNLTILGVIADESLGDFKTIYGDKFVLCQYNTILYHISNVSFAFLLYGEETSTCTFVTIIEKSISYIDENSYSSHYYNYDKALNSVYEGNLQTIKQETFSFYGSSNKYLFFALFVTLLLIALFFQISQIYYLYKERSAISCRLLSLLCPLMIIGGFLISYFIFYIIGTSILFNIAFTWLGYSITTLLFYSTILSAVLYFILFDSSKNNITKMKKENDDSTRISIGDNENMDEIVI
ncbi:MAG: lipopolysaccharide biosynthesis protein [Clostridia bacterium]|nr:lipopolysaccharide biosynthesis protein [Clostridia bacterium]